MRLVLVCFVALFVLTSSGCTSYLMGGRSHSGLRAWKAYTFEGEYNFRYRSLDRKGNQFTVEKWKSVEFEDGTYCLWLELSQPDDRWSPDTAGPFHNYTTPFANLFILSDQAPPYDVTLINEEGTPVSVWMMKTGYVYDLTDERKLRERLQEIATRFAGHIEVRRGWNDRLYVDFDIASEHVETDGSMAIKGELMTHRHCGIVTWRSNAKGIRSRFNESWSESTWP